MRWAKETGHAEGHAEGQEEGRKKRDQELLDNARRALAKGHTVEAIHEITGLDIETISNLDSR